MNQLQKFGAALGGIGILAIAIWLGTIIFVALLVLAPLLYLYGRWKMGKMKKEFEAQHARMRESQGHRPPGGVIDGDYSVIEEPLDDTRPPRP